MGTTQRKAIDARYTGGVIPSVDPANTQEYDVFPALIKTVFAKTVAGERPETVTGDKGLRRGEVLQVRDDERASRLCSPGAVELRSKDHPAHDRDGVKRCDHCGGEMKQTRFARKKKKDTPWLWFRCAAPLANASSAQGEQTHPL